MVNNIDDSSARNVPAKPVETTRFGQIEVDEERIITMTTPFLGFPESNSFVLLPHSSTSPFMWFQSLDNPKLAFVVIQPAVINPEYSPTINSQVSSELMVSAGDELELLLILTIPAGPPSEITANLLGPIVINAKKRLAKQMLLDPAKYDACWPVVT